jgi:hypothetical protein
MNDARTTPAARKPFVAGSFYPADAGELRRAVEGYLAAGGAAAEGAPVPKAIIAPHAGYVYSGPVAGTAYARLKPARGRISRVVLAGSSHRVGFAGIAVPSAGAFDTPLGPVPLNREAIGRLRELKFVVELDEAHAAEHSLEVHLPFLQLVLSDFTLVPLVVGDAPPDQVAKALDLEWGGPETLIVISSDLSHYHPYGAAERMDSETARAITALEVDGVSEQGACGRRPIRGLLELARRKGMRAAAVDLRNSGDTAGPRDRVVGYGSFVFEEPVQTFDADSRETMLSAARRSIEAGADTEPTAGFEDVPDTLRETGASFVTLTRAGVLRGCIGSLEARAPLIDDVARNAWRSAYRDPRFPPVAAAEFAGIHIGISVLGAPEEMAVSTEDKLLAALQPGIDGLILMDNGRRGTFLPQVWETLPDPATFLRRLKRKAGLPEDHWSESVRAWRYETESFGEPAIGRAAEDRAAEVEKIARPLHWSVIGNT